MLFSRKRSELPTHETALPGRSEAIAVEEPHLVLGTPITPPFSEGSEQAVFAMGCFWGADAPF